MLKRVVFYGKNQKGLNTFLESLALHNIEVTRLHFNDKNKEQEMNMVLDQLLESEFLMETICITDSQKFAKKLVQNEIMVIGLLCEENQNEYFSDVKYVISGFVDMDFRYIDGIYKRLKGIPWQILETNRCLVREITLHDIDSLYEIYKEPAITEQVEDLFEKEEEIEYTKKYIDNIYGFYGYGMWIIEEKKSGRVIGRAGLELREGFEEVELGYVIGVKDQKKGYGFEVCTGILKYAKEELGFFTVHAFIEEKNKASIQLILKLGFIDGGEVRIKGKKHHKFEKSI